MKKMELSALAKSIKLPSGWKIQRVFAKHRNGKEISDTDHIYIGIPVTKYLEMDFDKYDKQMNSVLKQLNKGRKNMKKWEEFGGGYGFGKWYDIHLGINYDE